MNVHTVLVALSAADVALLVAVLAIYLFGLGVVLRRIADNLDRCLKSVQQVERDAAAIIPGVQHVNASAGQVAGALPLLYGAAERIAATLAPAPPPEPATTGNGAPTQVAVPGPADTPASVATAQRQPRHGRGYLDED